MYPISILFTKYEDLFSRGVYYLTGRKYTHVSINIDENDKNTYYSFNKRGFKIENIEKYKAKIKSSILYTIYLTKEKYEKLKEIIERFKKNKAQFKYNLFGVLLCVLGIPYKFDKRYFCSQFVAEILKESESVKLKSRACLYHPNKLEREFRQVFHFDNVLINSI